jgi:hypothetical protein
MSLDHLNRLAAAAGFATAVGEDDDFGLAATVEPEAEFVPLTRSHWPDAPAPRKARNALVPVAPLWRSQRAPAPVAWSSTAAWAMRSVAALVTGRGVPA